MIRQSNIMINDISLCFLLVIASFIIRGDFIGSFSRGECRLHVAGLGLIELENTDQYATFT
jgi:hypothetical protein